MKKANTGENGSKQLNEKEGRQIEVEYDRIDAKDRVGDLPPVLPAFPERLSNIYKDNKCLYVKFTLFHDFGSPYRYELPHWNQP
jgi:hypothetical protein